MNATPKTADDLFQTLDDLSIPHRTVEHPPLFTVEDGREWWHKIEGLHCKNLFLKDKKDKIWLIVMPGDKRADLNKIEKKIKAARISFAKPELLLATLRLTPGSVTPFGLINDTAKQVAVVLDGDLFKSDELNFHPLRNTASTTIHSSDLLKFIRSLGYDPLIVEDEGVAPAPADGLFS